MDNNQLNQDMKWLFNQYRPELDTDEIWENIEPFLDPPKKKKRRVWLWPLLGLTGAGLIWLFRATLLPVAPPMTATMDLVPSSTDKVTTIPPDQARPPVISPLAPTEPPQRKLPPTVFSVPENHNANNSIPVPHPPQEAVSSINAETAPNLATSSSFRLTQSPILQQVAMPLPLPERDWEVDLLEEISSEKSTSPSVILPKNKKPWRSELQFYWAPELALHQFGDRNTVERDFINRRKATESPGFSYRLGMNYQLIRTNGILFTTGINYEQINDRFRWSNTSSSNRLITGITTVTVNAQGDTLRRQSGPKNQQITTTESRDAINRYHFINLPVGIGFEKRTRQAVMKFTTGVNFNLAFSMKGYILSEDFVPQRIDRSDPNNDYHRIFNQKIRMGLWAGYEYSQAINPQLSWMVAPEIQLPLTSLTRTNYSLKQKFYSFQLRMGVNYLLR